MSFIIDPVKRGIGNNFLRLTDDQTSYTMLDEDDMVEVVSPTYQFIYLPSAVGRGGKKYTVLRAFSGPGILRIVSPLDEFIDGSEQELLLVENNQHAELLSNDVAWNTT